MAGGASDLGFRIIVGSDRRNVIDGKDGRDWIRGEGGDDRLSGQDGDDRLDGGVGDDSLDGGAGDDELIGGIGNDNLEGDISSSTGNDLLTGGSGDDRLVGRLGRNVLDGGAGDDVALTGADDLIDLGAGDDLVRADPDYGAGRSEIVLGPGIDRFDGVFGMRSEFVEGQVPTVWTGFGTHVLQDFTPGEDLMASTVLFDQGLFDRPLGFAELDGNGDGRIDGDDAGIMVDGQSLTIDYAVLAEQLYAVQVEGAAMLRLGGMSALTQADFVAKPTAGDDRIVASTGDDRVDGGAGDDVLDGGHGEDALAGGAGDDQLLGGSGDDRLDGGTGDDILEGGEGRDVVDGGDGADIIRAHAALDRIDAGAGDDRIQLSGSAGSDEPGAIALGTGRDRLSIQAEAFYTDPERWEHWSEPSSSPPPPENWRAVGHHVVEDFTRGEDTILGVTDGWREISFAEIDGNGDGRVDAGDRGVELVDGGLQIDLAAVALPRFGLTSAAGPSILDLPGVARLEAGDFAERGTAGDDQELTGSSGDDVMNGLAGDDQVYGRGGDDRLSGDAGDDFLHGGDGDDVLAGGAGNDLLDGEAGDDRLSGGEGDDILIAEGRDLVEGGAGDDVVHVSGSRAEQSVDIMLGAGADTFELRSQDGGEEGRTFAGFGSNVVRDFTHDEDLFGRISFSGGAAVVGFGEMDGNGDGVVDQRDPGVTLQDGGLFIDIAKLALAHHADQIDTVGDSTLLLEDIDRLTVDDFMRRPTGGADDITATSAADTLRLGGGDDVVHGAEGDDVLLGEAGADKLYGEAGNDVLGGGSGSDVLSGGSGANRLLGGDGSDFLEGSGQPGALGDFMAGGAGNDRIQGSRGDDVIQGGAGDDAVAGRRGGNQVSGGAGDDLIEIGMDDRIHAGIGDDVVQVASRPNYEFFRRSEVTLGSGNDRFEMTGDADDRYGRGFHKITDFRHGEDLLGELGFGDGRTIGFDELDGNGDGVVDRHDQGVGFSQGGLFIDLTAVAQRAYGAFEMGGQSALRLSGIDALHQGDFSSG